MAYAFSDGFDFYAIGADALAGWWDSGNANNLQLVAGRFTGSRAFYSNTAQIGRNLIKASSVNDAVHHVNLAIMMNALTASTNNGSTIWFVDGTTVQCSVTLRGDGYLLLYSGAAPSSGGTPLATYPNAVSSINTWTTFEIEVVINNTTGSFTVRKNGNPANDHQTTGLNTRTTANNYANRLELGQTANSGSANTIDDFIWRSDASSVPWIGDVRALQQMPNVTVSGQFSRAVSSLTQSIGLSSSGNIVANQARYSKYVANYTGGITSATLVIITGFTGNIKMAVFADSGGVVGTPIQAAAAAVANPSAGTITFTFSPVASVVKGTTYWLGFCCDTAVTSGINMTSAVDGVLATSPVYASWPGTTSPSGQTLNQNAMASSWTITPTANHEMIMEVQQDGTSTYVYDSVVGHADLYDIADLPGPATIFAVTTRGFMAKGDAGSRFGQLQMKSGGITSLSPALNLSSNFLWAGRIDLTNPNGGAAWTQATVSAIQIGPLVQA